MMSKRLAPLGLLFPVAGVIGWVETGDWAWGVYGVLALAVFGAVGATVDNLRGSGTSGNDETERSER